MAKKVFTGVGNSHFVTFRCAGRRRLLSRPAPRQIVVSVLSDLVERGRVEVAAFVVMPDHVHALMWYPNGDSNHSNVVQTWKRLSSHYLIKHFDTCAPGLSAELKTTRNGRELPALWTRRFFDMNAEGRDAGKMIDYMHYNPVKAGLVVRPEDWKWGSAPWYLQRKSVGVRLRQGV